MESPPGRLTETAIRPIISLLRGSLAQLVEQRTFNPLVAGSNPARPTIRRKPRFHTFGSLAQLVEQRTFNPLVAGSNPARPTKIHQESPPTSVRGLFCF